MSFNLDSYIEGIKQELAKYKVQEVRNVCKAFNQRARIYITGKSKSQLIDEIADRLGFLLKTDYEKVAKPGVQRKARVKPASAEVSEEEEDDDEEISDETNRLLEQLGKMRRPELPIKELENLKKELEEKAIRLQLGKGKPKRAKRAKSGRKYKGGDVSFTIDQLKNLTDGFIKTGAQSLQNTIGRLPGMDFLENMAKSIIS